MNAATLDPTDFVILVDAPERCFVDFSVQGDPGRTMRIEHATTFATANEVAENLSALRRQYPRRQFKECRIRDLPGASDGH